MMAFELYAVLAAWGPALLGDYVTRCFDLGRRFGELLEETPDFELPVFPEANIVCFRHVPLGRDDDLDAATRAGRKVLGVVANAGSTPVGAFDPLEPIADFCAREGLWLHVDGAHGAAAALSPKYRGLVAGIGRADSVVWDAHKMLLIPALVTAVLFRDARHSWEPFAEEAPYLFPGRDREAGVEWYDVAHRTLECTKRMMAFELYAVLAAWGPALLGDYVTRCFDLGRRFGELLEETPDFELPVFPEANIVCFRYVPLGRDEDLDGVQDRVRRRLLEDGSFYLVQTRLDGAVHLRTTLIHPRTSEAALAALLTAIRRAAAA
jgi:L-2,4-diaminobutyrate decarboxylase